MVTKMYSPAEIKELFGPFSDIRGQIDFCPKCKQQNVKIKINTGGSYLDTHFVPGSMSTCANVKDLNDAKKDFTRK